MSTLIPTKSTVNPTSPTLTPTHLPTASPSIFPTNTPSAFPSISPTSNNVKPFFIIAFTPKNLPWIITGIVLLIALIFLSVVYCVCIRNRKLKNEAKYASNPITSPVLSTSNALPDLPTNNDDEGRISDTNDNEGLYNDNNTTKSNETNTLNGNV